MNLREFNQVQIDQMIFMVIGKIQRFYTKYMNESFNTIIQSLISSQNVIQRLMILRKTVENLEDVMEIVNKNFKQADEAMIQMHTQARAKMSIEYIKSTYLNKGDPFADPRL